MLPRASYPSSLPCTARHLPKRSWMQAQWSLARVAVQQLRTPTFSASYRLAAMSTLRFHTFDVSSQVFLQREHVLGIVNLKPIVPLHVLIIPRREYKRLSEVPRVELHELFETVQSVSSKLEELVGATSCTVAIQDGPAAGQSVPHLHIHILPRKKGDFTPKDEIYKHLEDFGLALHRDFDKMKLLQDSMGGGPDASEMRTPRSAEEMKKEADWLREACS